MARKYENEDVLVDLESFKKVGSKVKKSLNEIKKTEIPKVQSEVDNLKEQVKDGLSAPLVIVVHTSENFEGKIITAKSKVDGSTYRGTIKDGMVIIKVKTPGEYVVSNNYNDTTLTAFVGEPLEAEVYFTDFYGSIDVTVPEVLVGETLKCVNGSHTVEQEIKSTVEVVSVFFQGSWEVSIKDNIYVQKATVELQEVGESQSCSLSVDEGVPYITVTVIDELKGEPVTCKKDSFERKKDSSSGTVQFLVPEIGHYEVYPEVSELLGKTVEVIDTVEYKVTLDFNDLKVPILIVKSKPEDDGKTIKVWKDETNYEKPFVERQALFALDSQGIWTVGCDDYPDDNRSIDIYDNKIFRMFYRASRFGVKVIESESDTEKRLVYIQDAEGMTPVQINLEEQTTNYNDWDSTWIFDKFYPVMLKTDGTEDYRLDPNDYSKKLDGSPSDIADMGYDGNAMVCIEKFYTKFSMDGDNEVLEISDKKEDGFEAIGFYRADGTEADRIYISTYLADYVTQSKARSINGGKLDISNNFATSRNMVTSIGANYEAESYAMTQVINVLYYILFKDCNIEKVSGCRTGFQYQSGTCDKVGAIGVASGASGNIFKFMYFECFCYRTSNVYYIGMLSVGNNVYIKMKPPYSTSSTNGHLLVSEISSPGEYTQYITKMKCSNSYGRIPISYGGSANTYENSMARNVLLSNRPSSVKFMKSKGGFGIAGWDISCDSQSSNNSDNIRISYIPPNDRT